MPPTTDYPKYSRIPRNIVFCGETGVGKSSVINLLLSTAQADVSNGAQPCTQSSTSYEAELNSGRYKLWDTRGLGEGRGFFQIFFRRDSVKELKNFLKQRHQRHELDLLVYCVRANRVTAASAKYYHSVCAITRQLAAPVVVVVTHSERVGMGDWWNRNASRLEDFQMKFDGHVCITTLAGHPRLADCKTELTALITGSYRWAARNEGSYFGIPVRRQVRHNKGSSMVFKPGAGNGGFGRQESNYSGPTSTSSPRSSSYHTVPSPGGSVPPTPISVELSTPRAATPVRISHSDLSAISDLLHSTSDGSSSAQSSPKSMFTTSPPSSCTSISQVHLPSCTGGNKDRLSKPLLEYPTTAIKKKQDYPIQHGAFGYIWECELISTKPPFPVAVKAVKVNTKDDRDPKSYDKKLRRELRIWGSLQHRNIVPLLGVVSGFGPLLSMVSPWYTNGSLTRYLARCQTLNLTEKHRLLRDIAAGLSYLHDEGVIHGDLHSDNVLIDDDGVARLTDFGLSLIDDFVGTPYLQSSICGGVQFADPALVKRVDGSRDTVSYPTKPCDVYSFGGLILHVMSGKKPYADILSPVAIYVDVLKGVQPQIPSGDNVTLWHRSLIQKCWDNEEPKRPSAHGLVQTLEFEGPWRP